ncbi:MAG: DNA translocase FtsK, partial [Erysipelotrichaceae bacterium]|nr:DNA translocase FtsK [Erysipelotrichaceae bacterium]
MSKTRRKKKAAGQNSFIGYTYLIIAIVLCLIALMHEMTGFLGRWLFSAGSYLFGQLWFVPYVIVIIMCLLKAYKVEMPAKLIVTMILFFLATALILACLSFKESQEPLKLISEYFHNTREIFAGKAMGRSGLLGIALYGLIASAADYWGVIIVICVLFIVGILIHTEEIKKRLKTLKKPEGTRKTAAEKNRQPSFFDLDEQKREEKRLKKEQRRFEKEQQKLQKQEKKEQTVTPAAAKQPEKPAFVPAGDKSASAQKNYMLPSLSYLDTPVIDKSNVNRDNAREKWASLSEILSSFDLDSSLEGYNIGPSITQFEIVPKSNFNINKYATIERNIRMALAVSDVRIEAPIPGKRAVGIEIPNVRPTLVTLKEMLKDVPDEYQFNPLMIAVGKNIAGKGIYGSINKMPHMLIAGATGSGKSVCINSIIMTILMRARPDEVKLLLIDPKKVEFSAFDNIPHLITPIITETDKAAGALAKLIQIMEKRFDMFSQNRCQNIDQYNKSVADDQKLCSIVCIIDELADLMMTHRNEVEPRITRLASLARAAGIYMILATQRPSTDIITGTIK